MKSEVAEPLSLPDVAAVEIVERPRSSRAKSALYNALAIIVFLGIWWLIAALLTSPYIPTPAAVLQAFVQLVEHGDTLGNPLWLHVWASTSRVLGGFLLAAVIAVPLGLLMGLHRPLYDSLRLVIEPFRFIPPIAWIPIAIILLRGYPRYIFLIWLGAFFPIFIATIVGVPRVQEIHQKVALVCGASRAWIIRHIIIPSVMPDIIGGMRVGMGTAWMTIVAAEFTGGEPIGIGRMMVNYGELLQVQYIVVGMILIGTLGFLFNEALLIAEKRLFRWRAEVRLR
jgi:ABC-type nitrate/sulfonate/bicarbonate transport system permease component